MTAGKYFNRAVMGLDDPHLGFVVRETPDKIVVFGEKNERFDIPISDIQHVSKNVLIGLNRADIEKKYKVSRDAPLLTGRYVDSWGSDGQVDLTEYMRRYGKTLFNKGVRLENEDHVGHVMKETDDKIVIFGEHNNRFDVPKSFIRFVGRNVILGWIGMSYSSTKLTRIRRYQQVNQLKIWLLRRISFHSQVLLLTDKKADREK